MQSVGRKEKREVSVRNQTVEEKRERQEGCVGWCKCEERAFTML
jgi:hypothetical protein